MLTTTAARPTPKVAPRQKSLVVANQPINIAHIPTTKSSQPVISCFLRALGTDFDFVAIVSFVFLLILFMLILLDKAKYYNYFLRLSCISEYATGTKRNPKNANAPINTVATQTMPATITKAILLSRPMSI